MLPTLNVSRPAWIVLLLLDCFILTLILVGYVARYIPPRYVWWPQLIAVALPYLSVLLLLITAGVALGRWWSLLGVHIVWLLLLVIRFMPSAQWNSRPDDRPDYLAVMSFNAPVKRASTEVARREMVALVHDARLDLLCLQDAMIKLLGSPPRLRPVKHLVPLLDSLRYATILPEQPYQQRLRQPVLSRLDLVEQTETVLRLHPKDETPARVVRTEFDWQGQRAVVYNLHLRSFGWRKPWRDEKGCWRDPRCWKRYLHQYREAFRVRAWEAEQIRPMLERETLPLIVCGDFNSTPHHWVYHHLSSGLTDAFAVAGRGWGATYSSQIPFVRIDYVLVSAEWQVGSAYVGRASFSDHLPLIVELELTRPSQGTRTPGGGVARMAQAAND